MTDILDKSYDGVARRLEDRGDGTFAQVMAVDEIAYAEIIDTTTSATYSYHCETQPGTATSAASWRISRLTVATGVIQWADGDSNFDNIADNRATTQVYS